jgi:hypothetical protein
MKNARILNLNSMNVLRSLMMIGLSILFFTQVSAQGGSANFSGNWALNESKSKFGDSPFRRASTTLVVKQDGNTLSTDRTMAGPDGEMKMTTNYTLDGKVSENTGMMDMKSKSTVAWSEDKTSITISTTMVFDMNGESREIKSTEIWKLSDAGKTLTIDSTMPAPDGEMKTSAVYDKK